MLTYEDLRGPALRIASQVQDLWTSFRQIFFIKDMYDGGVPYKSPIEAWINKACQSNPSPWHQYQGLQAPAVIRFPSPISRKILVHT